MPLEKLNSTFVCSGVETKNYITEDKYVHVINKLRILTANNISSCSHVFCTRCIYLRNLFNLQLDQPLLLL